MTLGIIGATSLRITHSVDDVTRILLELVAVPGYDANHLYSDVKWQDLFPGNVIVKCEYCGQWGATKCPCKHCGVPLN